MKPRAAVMALVLVVGLGAALRFHRLGAESLWLDETVSVQMAHESLDDIVYDTTLDVHPPLYYFALHYWMRLTGDSETAVRALSALFGCLALFAIYRLGARLFDPWTGVIAALLMALSTFHLQFSQETRMYALVTLLSILSMDGLIGLMREEARAGAFAAYVAATAALLFTHIYGAFVFAGQVVFVACLLLTRSRQIDHAIRRRLVFAQAAVAICYLPWLERLFEQVMHVQGGFWIPPAAPTSLLDAVIRFAGSARLAWVFAPLALLTLVFSRARSQTALLWCWLGCVVGIPLACSLVSSPIFLPKYTIAALGAVVLLVARGVTILPGRLVHAAAVTALVGLSIAPVDRYFSIAHKQDWRGMTAHLSQQAQAGDLVLFNQAFLQTPFDYYARRTDLVEQPFAEFRDGLTERSLRVLSHVAVLNHARVWIVADQQDPVTPILLQELGDEYRTAYTESDKGVAMYLLVR